MLVLYYAQDVHSAVELWCTPLDLAQVIVQGPETGVGKVSFTA